MNLYGNYIEESTLFIHAITEEEILQEGVGIDLYKKFAEIKKYYRQQKVNLEEDFREGDVKSAKKTIKDTIDYMTKASNEIRSIDDSEFSSKVGIFGIQCFTFIVNSIGDMLVGGGSSAAVDIANNVVLKQANSNNRILRNAATRLGGMGVASKSAKAIARGAIIAAIMAIAKPLYNEITKQIQTHQRIQYKINREMTKNHKSKEEAEKAVGGLYKNEIIDYIGDIIYDLRKIDGGLKV